MSQPQPSDYEFQVDDKDRMRIVLPVAVSSCQQMEAMNLSQIRDRINSLEMQAYGLYLRAIFEEFPGLAALRIENTDDHDDNGRHIGMIVEDSDNGEDWDAMDTMLDVRADYLNNAIRHRGIYDYIDEILSIGMLSRDKIDQQLAKAYDATFEEVGAWAKLQAQAAAAQLDGQTSSASSSTPRSRM